MNDSDAEEEDIIGTTNPGYSPPPIKLNMDSPSLGIGGVGFGLDENINETYDPLAHEDDGEDMMEDSLGEPPLDTGLDESTESPEKGEIGQNDENGVGGD